MTGISVVVDLVMFVMMAHLEHVDGAEPHASLRSDAVGKVAYRLGSTSQDHRFEAVEVIKPHHGAGRDKIVMGML